MKLEWLVHSPSVFQNSNVSFFHSFETFENRAAETQLSMWSMRMKNCPWKYWSWESRYTSLPVRVVLLCLSVLAGLLLQRSSIVSKPSNRWTRVVSFLVWSRWRLTLARPAGWSQSYHNFFLLGLKVSSCLDTEDCTYSTCNLDRKLLWWG